MFQRAKACVPVSGWQTVWQTVLANRANRVGKPCQAELILILHCLKVPESSDPFVVPLPLCSFPFLPYDDRRTMMGLIDHFSGHVAAGKSSPGLLIVSQGSAIGDVVEVLLSVWALSDPSEVLDQVWQLASQRCPELADLASPTLRNPKRTLSKKVV